MVIFTLAALLFRPATVTYSCSATRLDKVITKLAEITGEPLKLTGGLESKFVVMRFKDTPTDEALARVAKGVTGRWVSSGGFKILQSDGVTMANTRDKAFREAILKYLAPDTTNSQWSTKEADKYVADAMALADNSNQAQDKWMKIQELEKAGPSKRLIKRLARLLGEKEFTSLPSRSRVVFSSSPTRMQRAFPAGAKQAVDQYLREAKFQQEALQRKGIDQENPFQSNYYIDSLQPRAVTGAPIDKVQLTLKRSVGTVTIQVTMRANDESGGLDVNDTVGLQGEFMQDKNRVKFDVKGDYQPSEETKLLGRAIESSMGDRNKGSALNPEENAKILEIFKDLEAHELLSYAPSEVLLQAAEAKDKDMVACLSDVSVIALMFANSTEAKKSLSSLFNEGPNFWRFDEDEKGFCASTIDQFFGMTINLPRKQMGAFVTNVSKNGLSIDALADLISATDVNEISQFILQLSCVPFPNLIKGVSLYEGIPALRAYGLLDQGSRQKAKNGGYVAAFRSLPPAVQASISDFVYYEAASVSDQPPQLDNYNQYGSVSDLDHEATSVFPNGVPGNTEVTFRVRAEDTLFLINQYQGGYTSTRPTKEDDAANQLAWAEISQGRTDYNQVTKVATGVLKRLDLIVKYSERQSNQSLFMLSPSFKDSDMKSVDQLPEDRRKSLAEKIAKQKESLKDVKFGPTNTNVKP